MNYNHLKINTSITTNSLEFGENTPNEHFLISNHSNGKLSFISSTKLFTLDSLAGIDIQHPKRDQILEYDGFKWKNKFLNIIQPQGGEAAVQCNLNNHLHETNINFDCETNTLNIDSFRINNLSYSNGIFENVKGLKCPLKTLEIHCNLKPNEYTSIDLKCNNIQVNHIPQIKNGNGIPLLVNKKNKVFIHNIHKQNKLQGKIKLIYI